MRKTKRDFTEIVKAEVSKATGKIITKQVVRRVRLLIVNEAKGMSVKELAGILGYNNDNSVYKLRKHPFYKAMLKRATPTLRKKRMVIMADKKQQGRYRQDEVDAVRKLAVKGLRDQEIAERLNMGLWRARRLRRLCNHRIDGYTEDEILAVQRLAERGLSDEAVAERLGITYSRARRMRRMKIVKPVGHPKPIDPDIYRQAEILKRDGYTNTAMAEILKVSPATLSRYFNDGTQHLPEWLQELVVQDLEKHPEMSMRAIADGLNVTESQVRRLSQKWFGPKRKPPDMSEREWKDILETKKFQRAMKFKLNQQPTKQPRKDDDGILKSESNRSQASQLVSKLIGGNNELR